MRRLALSFALIATAACQPPPVAGPAGEGGARVFLPFDWEFRGLEPVGTGTQGMVATADVRATRVGLDILQAGGNGVDAAVAVGFALAVVLPRAGNIGGGGFAVLRKSDGTMAALDFRETAPLTATPDVYLDAQGKPTDAKRVGHLAVAVPGAVKGLWELHQRYGSLPWAELLAPAIDLAENGFTVNEELSRDLAEKQETLRRFETTRQIFYPGGEAPRIGSMLRQPMLAETLRAIAAEGSNSFYQGRIADLIVEEMRKGDGLITHEDLARYQAQWREPLVFQYRGHTVISMPPPSSGGVTLALILNILEGYDLRPLGFNSPDVLHLETEAFRRAFADRNYYLGDPAFVNAPIDRLTSDEYAGELRASISRNRASDSESFSRVPVVNEGRNTTHFSIVDRSGDAIALTYTLNSSFGSGVVVERGGFFLNNEIDDFTVNPGYANQFGLIEGDANLIEPGKRPLSSMTPTIVLDEQGQLRMVLGSPGGPKIITAVAQVISNVVNFGMDVRTAVEVPRIHHQLFPDELQVEQHGIDNQTLATLVSMGHTVVPSASYFGNVQLIIRRPDGTLEGIADPRHEAGRAIGY
jgi:gamma-glutamyltranspeptidase/glutathione hydrolase